MKRSVFLLTTPTYDLHSIMWYKRNAEEMQTLDRSLSITEVEINLPQAYMHDLTIWQLATIMKEFTALTGKHLTVTAFVNRQLFN